ncbi:acyltransferase family protein [Noviherbaspirillum sp. ST9]|uniref:acyltransferase family protein n=1 Tax=Noviherbaspirillum sp. ST9 TaxID=3401606 RepID=UPI003B58953B
MNHGDLSRQNNFDFLRIVAAFLVLVSHQFALNGLPEPAVFNMSLGTFAVLIFFSVSGFLVSQSWRHDPHALRFLLKRFLRIWPGLAAVTVAAAFVLGPLVSTLDAQTYFAHPDLRDFLRNLKVTTIRYVLPGVFDANPHPRAVNGSLWTIPLEVRCYFALLAAGVVGLMARRWTVALGTLACAIYFFGFAFDPKNYQVHFALYFFAGACLDLYRRMWEVQPVRLLVAAGAASLAFHLLGAQHVALLCMIPALVVFIGTRSTPVLNRFGRFGDVSYGVYIYAFPVQQTVVWMASKDFPFMAGLVIASVVTLACAFLSWHLVEHPALRLKARLPGRFAIPALFRRSAGE